MGFDKLVHSRPDFYARKLDFIAACKKLVYKLLFLEKHIGHQRAAIDRRNRWILETYLAGKKVLEVGCGRGSFLQSLERKHGCRCTGADISPEMIAFARSHYPGPDYHVLTGAGLPFADDEFDFVIFCYVLHHVAELDRMVAEATRVGRHVLIYESCAFERQPLKALSRLYWKTVDGGAWYLSLADWKRRFGLPVLEQVQGRGLVRYGLLLFQKRT